MYRRTIGTLRCPVSTMIARSLAPPIAANSGAGDDL